MPLPVYPLLIVVAVIIFYLTQKKYTKQSSSNRKDSQPSDLPYVGESEEEFTVRCFDFVTKRFDRADFRYHVSNNNSFLISYEREDGTLVNHNIDCVFNRGNSIILFYNRLTDRAVPDYKLADVAELVNRLNDNLFVGGLVLNYEYRIVECKLVYMVAGHELSEYYFDSYYNMLYHYNALRGMIKRVIENDENPALVALEWDRD